MEKELLDEFLKIIEINKNKKKILNEMAELELANKTDSEEYSNLICLYKRISSKLREIIDNVDVKDQLIMSRVICRLNPNLYQPTTFDDIISKTTDDTIVAKKTLIDLGASFMCLYSDDERESMKQQLVEAYAAFGIEVEFEDENSVDVEAVNYYMCSDFTNVLYSVIDKLINHKKISADNKKELIKLKYNIIFLAPNIEIRAIQTVFDIPDTPRLADVDTIIDTGIDYREYLDKLDSIMISLLEYLINNCLHMSDMNTRVMKLKDLVFIKAYASILNDSELLDCISLDVTNANSINYILCTNVISEVLKESKKDSLNNYKIRKYGRI